MRAEIQAVRDDQNPAWQCLPRDDRFEVLPFLVGALSAACLDLVGLDTRVTQSLQSRSLADQARRSTLIFATPKYHSVREETLKFS